MNNRIASLGKTNSGWIVFYHTETTPIKAGNSSAFSSIWLALEAQRRWIEDATMFSED